jgi:drug/metabolite transporter (DMT)-like permease
MISVLRLPYKDPRVPVWPAYILLVVIWSTTPLAIKWGLQGVGFMEPLVLRMALGVVLISIIMLVVRQHMPWREGAWKTYVIAAAGLASAMSLVYWGTQYISSGLLSVIGGTGPIITGVFATVILKEYVFTPTRVLGMLLGIMGLMLIFHSSILEESNQAKGIVAVLLAGVFQAFSAVMIKYWRAPIAPLALATGALWLALPCYTIVWLLFDTSIQPIHTTQAIVAIIYLALFGSVIGFVTYYYLIQKISANSVAMVSLITPVFAMIIGHIANHELWKPAELSGAICVLVGLGIYQLHQFRGVK